MLEKIGKSCSSFPTCGVYTQVPPTLGAFSHTTGIMPGVAEMWRAAQSPPAPAPITPTTFIICGRNQKSKPCEVLDCLLKKDAMYKAELGCSLGPFNSRQSDKQTDGSNDITGGFR